MLGAPLLNRRAMNVVWQVGSTYIDSWDGDMYPDFVAEGTGDQKAIMAAICAVKKASFDGVDCVGGDDAATGTVRGRWHRVSRTGKFAMSPHTDVGGPVRE